MNKLLLQIERNDYQNELQMLHEYCPETIKRKIPEANIQQAFVLSTTLKLININDTILSVGSRDDTASETLSKLGYKITEIDPYINCDLTTYYSDNFTKRFNIIISTSVIEHVQNDEEFISIICKLLDVGGYAILTCDFNNDYISKKLPKPSEDFRLYTKYDLLERLNSILTKNNCKLIGDIDYDGYPDFVYSGCKYTFASYVFKKEK